MDIMLATDAEHILNQILGYVINAVWVVAPVLFIVFLILCIVQIVKVKKKRRRKGESHRIRLPFGILPAGDRCRDRVRSYDGFCNSTHVRHSHER